MARVIKPLPVAPWLMAMKAEGNIAEGFTM
jgi:hypothetical protein